jgi:hypothetical protein
VVIVESLRFVVCRTSWLGMPFGSSQE